MAIHTPIVHKRSFPLKLNLFDKVIHDSSEVIHKTFLSQNEIYIYIVILTHLVCAKLQYIISFLIFFTILDKNFIYHNYLTTNFKYCHVQFIQDINFARQRKF